MFHVENTDHEPRRVSLKQPSRNIPVTQCHANVLLSLISAPFSIKILTTARSFMVIIWNLLRFLVTVNHGFCEIPQFFTIFVFRKEITGNHGFEKMPPRFLHMKNHVFFFQGLYLGNQIIWKEIGFIIQVRFADFEYCGNCFKRCPSNHVWNQRACSTKILWNTV